MPVARRLLLVDALRGFALFGIIQINLPAFLVGASPLNALLALSRSPLDWLAFALSTFLVEAKFYPLFAFLFGYGFGLQWHNLARRKLEPARFLRRRYLFLLALGVLHGTLLFYGDILTMYALSGLVMLVTAQRSPNRARKLIATWLALSVLLVVLQYFGTTVEPTDGLTPPVLDELKLSLRNLADGPFLAGAVERAQLYGSAQLYQLGGFLPQLLFFMSLGAYASRLGVLRQPQRYPTLWRRALRFGLIVGVPVNLVLTAMELLLAEPGPPRAGMELAVECLYPLAATLTPAYVALFVAASRVALRVRWLDIALGWLAQLGRLALTNYLLQSVGMLFLFSNLGLGLANRLSLAQLGLIGLATCLLQAAMANLYLRHFQMGPAEWVWRRFVYAPVSPGRNGPK